MDASAQPSQVMQEHVTKPENPFYGVKRDFVVRATKRLTMTYEKNNNDLPPPRRKRRGDGTDTRRLRFLMQCCFFFISLPSSLTWN